MSDRKKICSHEEDETIYDCYECLKVHWGYVKKLEEQLEWITLAVTEADDYIQMGKKVEEIILEKK